MGYASLSEDVVDRKNRDLHDISTGRLRKEIKDYVITTPTSTTTRPNHVINTKKERTNSSSFTSLASTNHPTHIRRPINIGRIWREFNDKTLLYQAFVHSSYLNENHGNFVASNDRMEFLGDAALGLAIAEALYKKDAEIQEGALTLIRQSIVNGNTLARAARSLRIGEYLLMGSGEEKSGGRNRNSNLAAAFESIVGAIFMDRGYDAAKSFCIRILDDEINGAYTRITSAPKQAAKSQNANKPMTAGKHPKSALQEISQARHSRPPAYRITEAIGKSNDMTFTAQVQVNGKTLGSGTGNSKKAAETAAAKAALKALA